MASSASLWLLASVALAALAVLLVLVLVLRRPPEAAAALAPALDRLQSVIERTERAVREDVVAQTTANRVELGQSIERFSGALTGQMAAIAGVQNNQIDAFSQQLVRLTEANEQRLNAMREAAAESARLQREELAATLRGFADQLQRTLAEVSERSDRQAAAMRETLEGRLQALQSENAAKLEEMRRTVDEKLQATLEQRLSDSFRLVSERLEAVHKGLGEMQGLASDVGDLKRVLTNVKARGTWGEVQLASLLEQMFVAGQYEANVPVVPGSGDRVEFALRLPGRADDLEVWLPIDAKFPREDYERLLLSHERADAAGAEAAGKALEAQLRSEAKTIRAKYVSPPHTTDFALLFLPVEGLYAEVVRRPGLVDELQRVHRVVVAGPTTLAAILSSLQMGFRTLAVEKRSSEVWQLLGAVKTEFGKFASMMSKAREQVDRAQKTLGEYETRSRAIERRLRTVQELPEALARPLLEGGDDEPAEPEASGGASGGPPAP